MIRSRPNLNCYLCRSPGRQLYAGLKDRLYNVPGIWNLRQCSASSCGLIWLDPLPLEEDIGRVYQKYFTHDQVGSETGALFGALINVYDQINHLIHRIIGLIRRQGRVEELYLNGIRPGKLLEIGCGAGELLAHMRDIGWEVAGIETDAQAIRLAREKYGLNIHLGDLASMNYPDESFDVIIMNHVIEHLHKPVEVLRECQRILKRGGKLAVVTPNIKSLAHYLFQKNWFSLDPPRHLHLFSPATLTECACRGGFRGAKVWSTSVHALRVFVGSMDIKKLGRRKLHAKTSAWHYFMSFLFQGLELILTQLGLPVGEEVVLLAEKDRQDSLGAEK